MGCQEQTPGSQVGTDTIAWSPDCRDGARKRRIKLWHVEQKSSNDDDDNDNGSSVGAKAPPLQLKMMATYFGHHLDR